MTDYEQLQTELLALPQVNGIVPVDILSLPQAMGNAIRGLVRDKSITSAELADAVGISEQEAFTAAELLVDKGYLLVVEDEGPTSEDLTREALKGERVEDGDSDEKVIEEQDLADEDSPGGSHAYRIRFARIKKHRISIDL